jgi:hypothetical protein
LNESDSLNKNLKNVMRAIDSKVKTVVKYKDKQSKKAENVKQEP